MRSGRMSNLQKPPYPWKFRFPAINKANAADTQNFLEVDRTKATSYRTLTLCGKRRYS